MTQQIWRHGETRLLFLSALMMGVVAIGGLWMGIQSHSQAILLDGIFSVAAMIIKLLMMLTALLTRRKTGKRFPFGYWQCEPAVMLLEGIFTFFIVLYALVAGMWGLWHGGREVEFGTAVYYAAFFTLADWSFYGYVR
ncbi:MAG: cation transporter, partial [Megasphaera lornae]